MMRTALQTFVGLALLLAVTGGACMCFHQGDAPVAQQFSDPTDWERPAAYDDTPATVVAVRAYIRSDAPMESDPVNWVLRVSCLDSSTPVTCDLQPVSQVENMEFANPDGTQYYIGVITASILVRRCTTGTRASFSHTLSRHYAPREPDLETPSSYTLPTILLEAELDGSELDMTWSVSNLDENDCTLLFKVLEPFEKAEESPSCRSLHI